MPAWSERLPFGIMLPINVGTMFDDLLIVQRPCLWFGGDIWSSGACRTAVRIWRLLRHIHYAKTLAIFSLFICWHPLAHLFDGVIAVIGQILGYLLISLINDDMLKAMIGAIAIIIGGRYFIRLNMQTRIDEKRKMRKNIPARASLWCSLSGFSSFISLTGGIPVQIFLLPLRMHRYLVVGTSAWFFFSINIAKIPFFLQLGMFTPATLFITLSIIPVIPVGVMIGKWLNRNITDNLFYHLVHAGLALLGLRLVWGIAASAWA